LTPEAEVQAGESIDRCEIIEDLYESIGVEITQCDGVRAAAGALDLLLLEGSFSSTSPARASIT